MQNRLKEKNLPFGITSVFFGAPGTGKTESVYQIAKETGRAIYKVDISNTKSMWFGESEKKIKQIFSTYNSYIETLEQCPILLFNEADAIISKRKESTSSAVSQTENAIQNIILEELENFKGIFFATTNLFGNMDSAFERRFLFKVEFSLPNEENRFKIWESKLGFLKKEELIQLASISDFSGGQIDNIVRKCELEYIVSGAFPDFEKIKNFCSEERNGKTEKIKIGFNKKY